MEYLGEDTFTTYIERKPHSTGFKMFLWCFVLETTNRPVLFKVYPDLTLPITTSHVMMTKILENVPIAPTSITADSWFTSLSFMEAHDDRNLTFALSATRIRAEMLILGANLAMHQYRVFRRGNMMLSLWQDGSLVVCASNCFRTVRAEGMTGNVVGFNAAAGRPLLSPEGANTISSIGRGFDESGQAPWSTT